MKKSWFSVTYRRDGVLRGFWGVVTTKVSHGAALGGVVVPDAFKHLSRVQVVKFAGPVLLVVFPRPFVAILIHCMQTEDGEKKKTHTNKTLWYVIDFCSENQEMGHVVKSSSLSSSPTHP
jgi:hypothetical protein